MKKFLIFAVMAFMAVMNVVPAWGLSVKTATEEECTKTYGGSATFVNTGNEKFYNCTYTENTKNKASGKGVEVEHSMPGDDECGSNGSAFFSLKPWYAGLTESGEGGSCEIKGPETGDGEGFAKFIWAIVLNILYDITVIAGYLTIVMVAWGGYLYMFSRGMPDRAERGKKTLIAAFVGLAIAMLASVILNTISTVLIG